MNPKITVCMAVYNGEKYLGPQLCTILDQLRPDDEVIIVDDASQDGSPEVLSRFTDPRVSISRNEKNTGVLASFEKALRMVQGDIIFLSDQDDLWLPGKIGKTLEVFAADPAITLVATDATVIDEDGNLTAESFYAGRGRFRPGLFHTLVKNKYHGCTLAFRSSMLRFFLPIPPDVPMHDMWFGAINQLYGKTRFIEQALIAYRRHACNLSLAEGAPLAQKLAWRLHLIKNVILRVADIRLNKNGKVFDKE